MNVLISLRKNSPAIGVLLLFMACSVGLYFLLQIIFYSAFANKSDALAAVGDIVDFIPYWWGLVAVTLLAVSTRGTFLFRKRKKVQLYKGFLYSLIFSLLVLVAYIIIMISPWLKL